MYAADNAAAGAGNPNPAESVARAQVAHLVGRTVSGRIKKFKDSWGFVNSDSFVGDLFLHTRSNTTIGNVGVGDPISFEVAEDPQSQGNFHAVNASMIKEEMQNLVGQVVRGWIKSFKGEWGLINSSRFDGDLFCGLKSNKSLAGGLAAGRCVEFQVASDEKGKNGLQAVRVKLIGGTVGGGGMQGSGGPAGMNMKPGAKAFVGRRCQGVIRSFREEWGFIVSPEFDGDLFVGKNSNASAGELQQGDAVVFEVARQANGKCQAINVQGIGTAVAKLVGQRCNGVVRKFEGNWGFITSTMFTGDVFVGLNGNKHLTAPLAMGDQVEFLVQRSCGKSGCEATDVQILGHGATPPDNLAAMLASGQSCALAQLIGRKCSGVVRKFDGNWGFITSKMYTGDLFVGLNGNKHVTTPLEVGDMVEFQVQRSCGKSGCEATEVQVVGKGATPPDGQVIGNNSLTPLVGQKCSGVVRKFDGNWGFITSSTFTGDLFVGLNGNQHLREPLATGDQVDFVVQRSSGKSQSGCEAAEVNVTGHGATPPNTGFARAGTAAGAAEGPPPGMGAAGAGMALG